MKSPQFWIQTAPEKVSSTAVEVFIPTAEMAQLLELSDNELTRLARSSVLVRQRDPCNPLVRFRPGTASVGASRFF